MIKIFILAALCLAYSGTSFAGTWTLENQETLRFNGRIENDEFDRFSKLFSPQIKNLIVTSGGGSTMGGIKIGIAISNQPVKIIVELVCASSCANYIFAAGSEREIRNGVVGFHGNVTACFLGKKLPRVRENLKSNGLTDEQISEYIDETTGESIEEQLLLGKLGISQALFDRSCDADKGMNDGGSYDLLLPSPRTFELYGFKNVIGEQDKTLVEKYKDKFVVD